MIEILKGNYLTDSLIDFYCEKHKFEEALKLAQESKHKLQDVYISQALYSEDQ